MNQIIDMIEKIVSYVETHIYEEFSLNELSDSVFISKFHMLRTFKSITGLGIMEYKNLRRLSLSIEDLLNSQKNISYISNKYGYAGSQSYIRAFKRFFDMTPSAFRNHPIELKIVERYNTSLLQICGDGILIEPEIKMVPEFSIAGLPYYLNDYENYKNSSAIQMAFDFFYGHSHEIKDPLDPQIYIGYSYVPEGFLKKEIKERDVFYMPSLMINQQSIVPKAMKKITIESRKYAIFKYIGYHAISQLERKMLVDIWDYIHQSWTPSVSVEKDDVFAFERLDERILTNDYCEILIYVPVE